MGWKSTVDITRDEAIDLILARLDRTQYEKISNDDLSLMVDNLGYGDDTDLPYYGYNFNVVDKEEDKDEYRTYHPYR